MKKWLFASLVWLVAATANAAAPIKEGVDYTVMSPAQPVAAKGKIEVLEFYSYTCIHCYHLEPLIETWAKTRPADVDFRREHISWDKSMDGFVKLAATLKATNLERLQMPVFDAVMRDKINLGQPDMLKGWIAKQPGVNAASFMQTYGSFGISSAPARAAQLTRTYQIEGTPTLVVGGKYATMAATPERRIEIINALIARVRAEQKK